MLGGSASPCRIESSASRASSAVGLPPAPGLSACALAGEREVVARGVAIMAARVVKGEVLHLLLSIIRLVGAEPRSARAARRRLLAQQMPYTQQPTYHAG